MIKTVMLAAKFDPDVDLEWQQRKYIKFPVLASTKIDGIRAHIYDGAAWSRKNKLIPNRFVQSVMGQFPNHLDGEITVGLATAPNVFNVTQSAVMSHDGEPDFHYWVFDMVDENGKNSAQVRQQILNYWKETNENPIITVVEQKLIENLDDLLAFEEEKVLQGWEGVMIRDPRSPYKQGRSTLNEGYLIKLKRFEDSEAEIIGCYEQETNTNEAVINEVGKSKRSSHKKGKIPNGHMGGFYVRDLNTGVEFQVGTMLGITKEQRYQMWENFKASASGYIGQIIKYKYQPVSVKEKPRQPIFLGFRSLIDM